MYKKGLSIVELLIVVALLGLVTVIVLSLFSGLTRNEALSADTQLLTSVIDQARSKTLSSQNASQYGVHINGRNITLFTGTTYATSTSSNISYTLSTYTTVTKSLASGGSDIIFTRLTGETSNTGTITLTANGKLKTITIFGTGVTTVQ